MPRKKIIRMLLKKLKSNPEMVKIYFLPGVVFLLDFVLRAVLGIDIIDAGADMALLAVTTFISLLIDNDKQDQTSAASMVVFIIIFLAVWIISLRIVSDTSPISVLTINLRPALSWFIGLTAFIFSGVITSEITPTSTDS